MSFSKLRPQKHPRNTVTPHAARSDKTMRLSLASKKRDVVDADDNFQEVKTKKARFAVAMPEAVEAAKKPVEVKNTTKSMMWVVHAFYSWREEHNKCSEEQ